MRKNLQRCLIFIFIIMVCTSCQILPKEEVLPEAPVIKQYQVKEYKQTTVMRGDLVKSMIVPCSYMPVKQEELSFSLGSRYIQGIYVSEGQQVQAGQLLAELEHDDFQEQIATLEYELQVLKLKRGHLLESKALELQNPGADKDAIEAEYEQKIQEIDDSLYISGLRLEEIKMSLRDRQIYAGISGTVTYVQDVEKGEQSVKGKKMITVCDKSITIFTVKGENTQYFSVGDKANIIYQKAECAATVVRASDIGLEEPKEDDEPIVYFKLQQANSSVEKGDNAKLIVYPIGIELSWDKENTYYREITVSKGKRGV